MRYFLFVFHVIIWLQTLHDCENILSQHHVTFDKDAIPPDTINDINKFHDTFITSMSDDLHTPVLLSALSDPLKIINDMLHTRKVMRFRHVYFYGY